MSDITLYRQLQLPEPQLLDDKFMGWASPGGISNWKYYTRWPFRICLGDVWHSDNILIELVDEFRYAFAHLLGGREEWIRKDDSFGYTPLMQAKEKYNKAVRNFNKVRYLPYNHKLTRHEDLIAFKGMLHELDWSAAVGEISDKMLKKAEKLIAEFEARYYPKAIDGPEAVALLAEIKP